MRAQVFGRFEQGGAEVTGTKGPVRAMNTSHMLNQFRTATKYGPASFTDLKKIAKMSLHVKEVLTFFVEKIYDCRKQSLNWLLQPSVYVTPMPFQQYSPLTEYCISLNE